MATGDSGRSQIGASDVICDFACTSCADDDKNTEALYHCAGCQMYYCERCNDFHGKLFKSHDVTDTSTLMSGQGCNQQPRIELKKAEELTAYACDKHPAEVIKMFCRHHDIVCCTVCIAMEHRSCEGVDYIPNIVETLLNDRWIQKTRQSLEKLTKDLENLKTTQELSLTQLYKKKDNAIKEIKELKHRIITRVEELERVSFEEIKNEYEVLAKEIECSLITINKNLKAVEKTLKYITRSTDDSASQFIAVKQGNQTVTEGSQFFQQTQSKTVESSNYEINTDIEDLLQNTESLGCLVRPVKAQFLAEYDLKLKSDRSEHLLLFDYNQYIITDRDNNVLKRVDENFKLIDFLYINGGPRSLCKVGRSEVAVTLYDSHKVAFVSVGNTMFPEAYFDVGYYCRGICSCQEKLYVCCGGSASLSDTDLGSINVYSMIGSLLQTFTFTESIDPLFPLPLGIASNFDGTKLFIADAANGLLTLEAKSGKKVSTFTNENFSHTIGLCEDDRGHLFVCNGVSNNVVEIDKRGNFVQEILTCANDIENPLCVTLLHDPKRLLITCRCSSSIKVFRLV